jgi:cytochrome c oxidase subunit 1
VLFRREMILPGLAKWQPYLFGIGMALFALFMMGAGTLGVSRWHWDMAFTGASMPYEYPGTAYLMMGLMGMAGVAAVVGGGIYIFITVGSLLWGRRLDAKDQYGTSINPLRLPPVAAAIEGHGRIGLGGFAAPGTFVFAMVFLVSFVLYYFVNWKYLSQVWLIG